MENNPIELDNENKIKIKPEMMVEEKLYPFIYEGNVFLFFKDQDKLIHCYEISDQDIKEKMIGSPGKILEILEESSKLV
jgi:hypothetical protein